jgi:hypothetical protein
LGEPAVGELADRSKGRVVLRRRRLRFERIDIGDEALRAITRERRHI